MREPKGSLKLPPFHLREPKGSPTPPPFHVMLFAQGIAEPGGYGGCIPHWDTSHGLAPLAPI